MGPLAGNFQRAKHRRHDMDYEGHIYIYIYISCPEGLLATKGPQPPRRVEPPCTLRNGTPFICAEFLSVTPGGPCPGSRPGSCIALLRGLLSKAAHHSFAGPLQVPRVSGKGYSWRLVCRQNHLSCRRLALAVEVAKVCQKNKYKAALPRLSLSMGLSKRFANSMGNDQPLMPPRGYG